jgi:hypothetical protein
MYIENKHGNIGLDQMNVTDIYRTFLPTAAEYIIL